MTIKPTIFELDTEVLEKSLGLATDIFMESEALREEFTVETMAYDLYAGRRPEIMEIVGETGMKRFTPTCTFDAKEEASRIISNEKRTLSKKFNLTPLNSKEGDAIKEKYDILRLMDSHLSSKDYFANKVPDSLKEESKGYTLDGKAYQNSPKLSKWITKAVGESSELVKWYTNRCPKGENVLGKREDYLMTLSVLPHHIAGMSYYAPANFNGKSWVDGYNSTSCMDTIRNGDGNSMRQLPSNLCDETLMVAYLTKVDSDESLEQTEIEHVFHARMLVRVAVVEGKTIIIGQRIYAVDRDSSKLITDAMSNEFGNSYVHCDDMTAIDIRSFKYTFTDVKNNDEVECSACGGDGEGVFDDCPKCEGKGKHVQYDTPYNDNRLVLELGTDFVRFRLPQAVIDKA